MTPFIVYSQVLASSDLFRNMRTADIKLLLDCLAAEYEHFGKGTVIFRQSQKTDRFGIVLSGLVQIIQEDYYGNKNILSNITAGDIFAESFAFAGIQALPVSVLAMTECDILFIDCKKLVLPCSKACSFHALLIQNIMRIITVKNVLLTQKIEIISKRTLREKILAYLSFQAQAAQNSRFVIPFDRQELADFLAADRSAVSAVLSKLRQEGLLKFHRNSFELSGD